ncbi:GAF and ANTAR domain-containing protein [Aeromicrobium phragmitis]|uniref:GAF and ANTAR domain-containing protein n=1 Tax=Aeromicrobium phragmitis TaxID=2478914 RepID=UPI001409BDAE|nr:GAF and ANTAR domain-containing protein [Aeromicrobium phragmitis]
MSDSFARRLADAARQWTSIDSVADLAREIAELAAAAIDGCAAGRISLARRDGQTPSVAYTEDGARRAGDLQRRFGEGPGSDALQSDAPVSAVDLEHESRWPTWAPRVVMGTGYHSVVSVRLYVGDRTLGVLELYGKGVDAFNAQALQEAELLAAQASSHLALIDLVQNLSTALSTRTVIGQAEGILMERYQLDAVRAFAMLRRVSQHTNTRLAEVAEELVETRRTPGAEA